MRNLLGRLHARRLPELLRIADAWGVPVHAESKGEVVATLYRAMTDPRTVRDLWDGLSPEEQAIALVLADAPDAASAPTVDELATQLGKPADAARSTALELYRAGILAREGDDEPLPVGVAPRLLMPREVALNIRRIQDEMSSGDLAQAPLRVLVELLDDAELESAARTWGMRAVPGVVQRKELTRRLLRLVNDRGRVEQVIRDRSRDAAAIWRVVRAEDGPVSLKEVAARTELAGDSSPALARRRAALAELEGALLVWHAYRGDGTRWLFIPPEIRDPGEAPPDAVPSLLDASLAPDDVVPWRHPDAFAWDLLTVLRVISSPQAPPWDSAQSPPRWLARVAAPRLWFGERDSVPAGYLELLQALALAEGVLAVDEEARPPRIVPGPRARAWRGLAFPAQTQRLRDRWLRLPRWTEGEPAGIAEIWGADWRGMRPRLLLALHDEALNDPLGRWVTLESLAVRIAARVPALLGPSFMAASARLAGEAGAGGDEEQARAATLSDVAAFELAGPFAWFGLTRVIDRPGKPRAISLTAPGAALAAQRPVMAEDDPGGGGAPLQIDSAGEVTLLAPSPDRVWALSAFCEPVDLGPESHYRLTQGSIGAALAAGSELAQIVAYLERGTRQPLPPELAANLAQWAHGYRRATMRHAVLLDLDDPSEREPLLRALGERGWQAEPHGERSVLVPIRSGDGAAQDEPRLLDALRAAGHTPRWISDKSEQEGLGGHPTGAGESPR